MNSPKTLSVEWRAGGRRWEAKIRLSEWKAEDLIFVAVRQSSFTLNWTIIPKTVIYISSVR